MPITASAKKALRQNIKHRAQNINRKKALKEALKNYKKLVAEKKMAEAKTALNLVYQKLDKSAKVNIITKNTASRLKSRLSKALVTSH